MSTSDEACVAAGIAGSALVMSIALVAVAHVVLREVPTLISKFRVCLLLLCLARMVAYVTQYRGVRQTPTIVSLQGWMSLISLVFGLFMILYFLENFVVALSSLAGDRSKRLSSAARSTHSVLRCWTVLRAFFVVYCLVLGVVFTVQPINNTFLAMEIGVIVAWGVTLLPLCAVTARLAFILRMYRLEVTERADTQTNITNSSAQLSNLKRIQRQLTGFVLLALAVSGVSVLGNIMSIRELMRSPDAPWQLVACQNSGIPAIAGRYFLMVVGLLLTRASRAPRRKKSSGEKKSDSNGRYHRSHESLSDHDAAPPIASTTRPSSPAPMRERERGSERWSSSSRQMVALPLKSLSQAQGSSQNRDAHLEPIDRDSASRSPLNAESTASGKLRIEVESSSEENHIEVISINAT